MAYTVYEYARVTPTGEPIEGSATTTYNKANGSSHQLAASTVFVAVVPDSDTRMRISTDGSASTAGDHKILANETRGFPVVQGSRLYLYGTAA